MAAPRHPAISAHRGGAEFARAGTYEAYRAALAAGADYVEFDVRRTLDGALVDYHDAGFWRERSVPQLTLNTLRGLAGYEVPEVAELLRLIAGRAGARAHVDLKDTSTADEVVGLALGLLAPANMIVTTRDAQALRAISNVHPGVPIGLTIGGDLGETARFALRRARRRRLSRLADVVAVHADLAVIHRRLATRRLLCECRSRGIGTVVWTVNRDLRRWVRRADLDILVTDHPARAIADRADLSKPGSAAGDINVM
jgi:glycerophosphoryl diester phosphodiesterase